jgi:hypothetical protein
VTTFELTVKGQFKTFKMEVVARELDHIITHLLGISGVRTVKVKKL